MQGALTESKRESGGPGERGRMGKRIRNAKGGQKTSERLAVWMLRLLITKT